MQIISCKCTTSVIHVYRKRVPYLGGTVVRRSQELHAVGHDFQIENLHWRMVVRIKKHTHTDARNDRQIDRHRER